MILRCDTRSVHILTSNISCRGARHFCSTSISYCRSSLASVVWHSPQTWNMVLKNNQQLICTYCQGLFPFILCNVPLLYTIRMWCHTSYAAYPIIESAPRRAPLSIIPKPRAFSGNFFYKKILIGDKL